jgi:hypothetical protein
MKILTINHDGQFGESDGQLDSAGLFCFIGKPSQVSSGDEEQDRPLEESWLQ